jgi:hypothetical protein
MNMIINSSNRKDQASSQNYTLKMTNILDLKENYSLCGAFSGTWILQTLDTRNWSFRTEIHEWVKKLLAGHLENFVMCCRQRTTNWTANGLNSKLMSIKRTVCGHNWKGHFRTAINFSAWQKVRSAYSSYRCKKSPSP